MIRPFCRPLFYNTFRNVHSWIWPFRHSKVIFRLCTFILVRRKLESRRTGGLQKWYPFLLNFFQPVKCPVHILHPENDELCPVDGSRSLEKSIKNAKLEILPGAKHSMSAPEDLEYFEKSLKSFLL